MAEELDIQTALDRLKPYDLNRIERVLAGNTGTVQYLLSLWFDRLVEIHVSSQEEEEGWITRTGALRAALGTGPSLRSVCTVLSYIDLSRCRDDVISDVRFGRLGLGQIAVLHQIPTVRTLKDLQVTPAIIRRTYTMEGPGLYYEITETYPRELYRE